ncbi:MAG: DUF5674 family protein [bacterium]|nr:DUF5674 family protein [bacterium]
MEIRIIKEPITREELKRIAQERYGDLVKAVVDVEQGIMAVGGGFHAYEEVLLMEQEHSKREHTWGINLLPNISGEGFLEFDSLVNLKPWLGNRSRGVEAATIREQIKKIVEKLILP